MKKLNYYSRFLRVVTGVNPRNEKKMEIARLAEKIVIFIALNGHLNVSNFA